MPSLRIEDQDLYYDWTQAGDDSLVLIFIHGLGSSSSFYGPIIPPLVERGYSCLAFDTPGSALSNYRGKDCDAEMICGAASALIAALNLDSRRIVVVGHSMGAIFASELALHLGLVGVVLIGPISPSDALAQVFAARIERVEAEGMEAMANAIPASATGPKATPTHRAFIRALLLAQSPQGYMSLCRTIAKAKCPRYGDIRCPLLVIAGSHDQTSPQQRCREVLQSWGCEQGRKRVEVLHGVGHWHCIEAADETCELVREFADGLSKQLP